LFEPAEDGAPHRKADVPDDQSRKPVGSLDAVGEVVGVEGDYPAHPVAEVEGGGERHRGAHRFTSVLDFARILRRAEDGG
jgi:hypothetical protein